MQYRDALDASKNCPKCCSQTLDRFLKKTGSNNPDPSPKPEKIVAEAVTEKKKQPKQSR